MQQAPGLLMRSLQILQPGRIQKVPGVIQLKSLATCPGFESTTVGSSLRKSPPPKHKCDTEEPSTWGLGGTLIAPRAQLR